MKYLYALLTLLSITAISAQEIDLKKDLPSTDILYVINLEDKRLEVPNNEDILLNLDPDMIEEITVIKSGSSPEFEAYKDKNVEGVIVITLKTTAETKAFFNELKRKNGLEIILLNKEDAEREVKVRLNDNQNTNILYKLNFEGKSFTLDSNKAFFNSVDPDDIESISVIKNQEGLIENDALDKDGVVVITLKVNERTKKLAKQLEKEQNKN